MKEKNLMMKDKWSGLKSQEINLAEVRIGAQWGYIDTTKSSIWKPTR
jgi:hypothetical protein